ncbi:cobyric acid synthase [Butyrivibrio sp. DSM 10294]|uniref:cobyric acid synthase n=1 Tax=Butyrivibrio sp. DSM 10294 TaxID=2972457 RepID=UPI00234E4A6E|nr:cobyric acid synthase [Butyrivibrio sp. DSM 10294]MDC7294532.1 cobyric acid synthase [Butyrivibrio sp. DSM 10294]
MAKNLMIQGTMSGVGKSILTAGILRVLMQDGYRVAPFKSQNMALNSFVTPDNREIGRAQALQAVAAGRQPSSDMNPILLKPMGDTTSQVIVNGLPIGNMPAREYFRMKRSLIPDIRAAYDRLAKDSDIIVIEGAGSPVEINLRENDIVNMGLAEILDAPVILAGDIDPGGVFAQLLGTISLFSREERDRVKGLIINKFRGDVTLLEPGLEMFGAYSDIPFAGIVPYVKLDLDEEDSVSERLRRGSETAADAKVRIAVVRLPFISNYTDFTIFENIPGVSLFYATSPEELEDIDIVILPGTKNTLGDLTWLYKEGFAAKIGELAGNGGLVIGICGGFQMLGRCITDPECSETGGEAKGLSLLHVDTVFEKTKNLRQVSGTIGNLTGVYAPLSGMEVTGYEIHMGESTADTDTFPVIANENVLGTYIHGIFDSADLTQALLKLVYDKKGITEPVPEIEGAFVHQEKELNRLADVLRQSLDWEMIYRIIGI